MILLKTSRRGLRGDNSMDNTNIYYVEWDDNRLSTGLQHLTSILYKNM